MEDTVRLSLEEPFDIVNFAISAPYPGTEWGEIAARHGWLVDKRWEAYDQNYSAQVSQPGCDIHLVKQYQQRAYLRWYCSHRGLRFLANGLRPEYLDYFAKTIADHLRN